MYSENDIVKLKSVQTKINDIYTIVQRHDGIVNALNDIEGQPALLMLLIAIAEQFNKLEKTQSKILEHFEKKDLKGIASVRNFIAHDYDGVSLGIIEDTLRYKLPITLDIVDKILINNTNIL